MANDSGPSYQPSAADHAKHLAVKGVGGWWEGVADRWITWIILALAPSGGWATWFGTFLAAKGIPMSEAIAIGIATAVPIVMAVAYARSTRATRRALAELLQTVINRNVSLQTGGLDAGVPVLGSPTLTSPAISESSTQAQAVKDLQRSVNELREMIEKRQKESGVSLSRIVDELRARNAPAAIVIPGTPRHLDDELRRILRQDLPKDRTVTIAVKMGESEPSQYAEEIRSFLVSEGYDVRGIARSPIHPYVGSIMISDAKGTSIISIGPNVPTAARP